MVHAEFITKVLQLELDVLPLCYYFGMIAGQQRNYDSISGRDKSFPPSKISKLALGPALLSV
jgi:hypothetical protein